MAEFPDWCAPVLAGALLGAMFYGGLWWTVQKGIAANQPAFWFLGSLVLRTSIALAGFYLVAHGHWPRLLLCLLAFVLARPLVTWLTRPMAAGQTGPAREVSHAP